MTTTELESLLLLSGYEARTSGGEVKVRSCWRCGNDRWNMELNPEKGLWSCWACRDGGRLDALLSSTLGTEISIPVRLGGAEGVPSILPTQDYGMVPAFEVGSALAYLQRRGLDVETIRAYSITLCTKNPPDPNAPDLEGRILFPVADFWTGEVQGFVGRSYTGKKPKYVHSIPRKIISGYRRRRDPPVVIVEGFLDGIAVHRAGFQAAVLMGTDSPLIEEFAARIPPRVPLVILLDGSASEESRRLYWRIFPIRPAIQVRLPVETDPAMLLPQVLRVFLLRAL